MSEKNDDTPVHATPTKRFFVEMLTRDIELDDALLDLLDNCVDGVLRETRGKAASDKPYARFHADIEFGPQQFKISDNCGGIDRKTAEDYAFLMGRRADDRRDADLPTVGMYGIGMKRAIFKLGRDATVTSQHRDGAFEVKIPPSWFQQDDNWELKAHGLLPVERTHGTTIVVARLQKPVKDQFRKDSDFEAQFIGKVRSHYAFIIQKGFRVTINGTKVEARPIRLLASVPKRKGDAALAPYMYDATINGVQVQVTVGFYRPLSTEDEAAREMEAKRSREDAGWTIICNDRVALYCDKTRATGWGEADVPSFHAQFNAISGVVVFSSADPLKLPLTTTKRGIEGSSDLYLRVKNRMREGMKLFTNYTYKWKHAIDEAKEFEKQAEEVELDELRTHVAKGGWIATRKDGDGGQRFLPKLPLPVSESDDAVVRFRRPKAQIRRVGEHLLDDPDAKPDAVGEAAFEAALKRAKQ